MIKKLHYENVHPINFYFSDTYYILLEDGYHACRFKKAVIEYNYVGDDRYIGYLSYGLQVAKSEDVFKSTQISDYSYNPARILSLYTKDGIDTNRCATISQDGLSRRIFECINTFAGVYGEHKYDIMSSSEYYKPRGIVWDRTYKKPSVKNLRGVSVKIDLLAGELDVDLSNANTKDGDTEFYETTEDCKNNNKVNIYEF